MLAPEQCYEAVVTDNTYTVLLMRESEISIDYELLLTAMKIGTESKEVTSFRSTGIRGSNQAFGRWWGIGLRGRQRRTHGA